MEVVSICGSWGHVVMVVGANIVEVVEVVAEGLCATSVTVAKVGHLGRAMFIRLYSGVLRRVVMVLCEGKVP